MGIILQIEIKVCELYCKGVYKGICGGCPLKKLLILLKQIKEEEGAVTPVEKLLGKL